MADVVIQCSFTLRDELGTSATMPFFLMGPDTSTLANVVTAMQAVADKLEAITGAVIERANVTFHPGLSGMAITPTAGARVEQTGLFNWSNTVTPFKWPIDVPAILDTVLTAGKIDLAQADVEAFTDLFEVAIGVFTAVTGGYDPLDALVDAALTFRKHRKQLTRSSHEPGTT
jgi:hypothetical protein